MRYQKYSQKRGITFFLLKEKISFIEGIGDYSEIKFEEISANKSIIYSNTEKVEYFPSLKQSSKDTPSLATAFNNLIDIFNNCVYIISSDRDKCMRHL